MFPKTKVGEKKHRKHKRELEISLAIETIFNFFKNNPNFKGKNINILEFGSGNGFQIPYLQQIGNVVASDIYTSNDIKNMKDVNFIKCSIINTPFDEEQFDIVFSSHVIEHIEDIHSAFDELKRIGKPNCIYVFSVPTNIWLLLAIPAQYYSKLRGVSGKLLSIRNSKAVKPAQDENERLQVEHLLKMMSTNNNHKNKRSAKRIIIINKLFRNIRPTGHGIHSGFIDCYRTFRIEKWQQLFSNNGFSIIKTQPLLLFAPSEWPIIPTTKLFNKFNKLNLNICSSVLFLMKKRSIER